VVLNWAKSNRLGKERRGRSHGFRAVQTSNLNGPVEFLEERYPNFEA
jgi:hypothetical protein